MILKHIMSDKKTNTKQISLKAKKEFLYFFPFILSAIGALLSFAVTIVLSRGLGKEKYGEIQYWLGIINTFSSFSAFGVPNFLIRDQHLYDDKKKFFTSCLLMILVLNLIAFPFFFIVSYFAFSALNKNILLIIALILCSLSSSVVLILQYQYLGLKKKNTSILISTVLIKITLLLVSTILIALSLINVLHPYFVYIYFGVYLLVLLPPLFKNLSKETYKFSKAQFLSAFIFLVIAICSGTNTQISKILIGEAKDNNYGAVAIYSIAVQVLTVISTFTTLIISFARPKFAEHFTNGDKENLVKLYRSVLRLTCRIAIPFYVGVVVQQETIFRIFGEGYSGFPLVTILLASAYLYSDICGPAGTIMAMGHQEKRELLINLIQFSSFLVIGFLLVKILYFAMPLAILSSYIISYTIRVVMIKKEFHFLAFDIHSLLEILLQILISFVAFFLLNLIQNIYLKLILDCLVGLAIIFAFYLMPHFRKDTFYFFKNV